MENINLRLVNKSSDANNSQIVIFQKNVAPNFDELSVAWRVISNLGRNDYHPFEYPINMEVCAGDSWGNYTPHLTSNPGESFHMILDPSGNVLNRSISTSPEEVEVKNDLYQGAISANIFKDGKLLATKTSVAPGQSVVFEFKPTIFIGVTPNIVEEGDTLNSAIISSVNTELDLHGIASADIIMTGGGPGNESSFEFNLDNIIRT